MRPFSGRQIFSGVFMKKLTAIILACICAVCSFAFSACDFGFGGSDSSGSGAENALLDVCRVTFVYNNGADDYGVYVDKGRQVLTPDEPEKDGCVFIGWYTDVGLTKLYDFSDAVKKDITLYAKYEQVSELAVGDYKVILVLNNGEKNQTVYAEKNQPVSTPDDPVKRNYVFVGWYRDASFTEKYDFALPVTKNLTLYAKYELDAVSLTNAVSQNAIKGVVKIYNKSYNTNIIGAETSYSVSQGSGFCFHIQDGTYYILTNCHVARKADGFTNQTITIEDYQGNEYTGKIYNNSAKKGDAISADYDLACVYFKPSSDINVIELEMISVNPVKDEDVIALGAPESQSNAVTYGKISGYGRVALSDTTTAMSNVRFDVISHTAYINHGSSGGPLLNSELKVVGVNFAGSETTGNGCAVPAEKVAEFLSAYVYTS